MIGMRATPRTGRGAPLRSRLVPLVPALLGGVLAAGCGSASAPSPPSGVDGLVVPTPSLSPADFVAQVDNPWLPLAPGATWTYRATTSAGEGTVEVSVLEDTREIEGVRATVVRTLATDPAGATRQSEAAYAQDDEGNVWQVAGPSWAAGERGAQAGLAMPATPRVGDGYQRALAPGVVEDRARVVGLDAGVTVPYGGFTGLLETEDTTPLDTAVVLRRFYAEGVGLVQEEPVEGGDGILELVAFTAP